MDVVWRVVGAVLFLPSLPDCSGGGDATCTIGGLRPGTVTVTASDLSLPVAVPMPPRADGPVPAPGDCVGSAY